MMFLPETYLPVLQNRKKMESTQMDMEPCGTSPQIPGHSIRGTLLRPLKLLFLQPICAFTCLFLSYASAIFFLFFESYPIIFQGTYGLSPGLAGLAFLPSKFLSKLYFQ